MVIDVSIPPWVSRILAFALALAALAGLSWGLSGAVRSIVAHHDRVAALENEIAIYRQLLADAPHRKTDLARLAAYEKQYEPPLAARNGAEATRLAQSKLRRAASQSGDAVEALVANTQAGQGGELFTVQVRLTTTGDIRAVGRLLYVLERMRGALAITRLDLAPASPENGLGAKPTGPHQLRLTLNLSMRVVKK